MLEVSDFILVGQHLALCLILINCKIQSELLEDVNGTQWLKSIKLRCYLSLSSGEDLELLTLQQVFEV